MWNREKVGADVRQVHVLRGLRFLQDEVPGVRSGEENPRGLSQVRPLHEMLPVREMTEATS